MLKFLTLLLIFGVCGGYKILLVFPVPGKSHSILGEGYVRHLLDNGHEVTYITPIPIQKTLKNLRQIDVSENTRLLRTSDIFDLQKLMYKSLDLQSEELISDVLFDVINVTLCSDAVQKLINDPKEEFDAVIVEWLYNEMGSGLSAVFNCPLIWSSSMVPHTSILSLIDERLNPAYNLFHLSRSSSLSLADRAYNIWMTWRVFYYKWRMHGKERALFRQVYATAFRKRARELPDFDEVRYNGSLVLGNSHQCIGDNIALPQNYKNIGGYYLKDDLPSLSQDLQKILDDAKHGVIYFSLGTILQSSRMPNIMKKELIRMFSELNQTVIWKIDEKIPNLPKNVHIIAWAPQQNILAHPNCVLFITHGGLLSIIEAINYGVPLIGMPLFGDQFLNTDRMVARGFGRRLDLTDAAPQMLKEAINEMLIHNSSYAAKAKEFSAIYHTRLTTPGQDLVFWVEYVIKTGGGLHLRSSALHVEWYKKLHLDIVLMIFIMTIITLSVLNYVFKKIYVKKKID